MEMSSELRIIDELDFEDPRGVVGEHAVWRPDLEIKIPFQFGGRITKYSRREKRYGLDTLCDEVAILKALGASRMAPPVGRWVYVRTLTSCYGGARRVDPVGAYGYELRNAQNLAPGCFDVEAARRLPITGSEGAWGDVAKPGNVVNGYLVDVRRTGWDMLRWAGPAAPVLPAYVESASALDERVRRDCQFPAGEREGVPYQDYWLNGRWHPGARRVAERAGALGFAPRAGESVVDLGCQSGGFLHWSWLRQREQLEQLAGEPGGDPVDVRIGEHLGFDVSPACVAAARDLSRAAGMRVDLRCADVEKHLDDVISNVRKVVGEHPDHLLCLSLDKHIGEAVLWFLVDGIAARTTYLETSAQREGDFALRRGVERRGGRHVGDSRDRNLRRLYVISREE